MTFEADSETDGGTMSTGELHAMLASGDRRHVLRYFRERDEDVATLEELADYLVARDGGFDDPAEAAVVLHHATLPKLAESVAIDYDPRTNVIRYRGPSRLGALISRVR